LSQFTDINIGPVLYRYTTGKEATPRASLVEMAKQLEAMKLVDGTDAVEVLAGLEVLHRVEASLTERIKLKQRLGL